MGSWRATIDPDSFTGFGTWSGTSFAAPAAAGAAAQALLDLALTAHKVVPKRPTSCSASSPSWASSSRTILTPGHWEASLIIDERDASDEHATSTWARRLDHATGLLEQGIAAAGLGQLTEAVSCFDRALETLALDRRGRPLAGHDHQAWQRSHLGARILLSQAFATHELGDHARATRVLDDALAISEAGGYDDIGVLVYAQRGAMLIREGQLKDALAQLDHAVDFLEYAPPVDRAKVLLNRGELHGLLGDLAQAKDDCALALRLALESGPAELVFYATHNLGWYEFLAGNLPRALELMPTGEDALPDFERGIVGMDRAKALLSAGLVTEADRSLIDVCAAFGRTELVQFLAEAELIRAEVALLADQAELAHTLSHQAVARLKRRHNRRAIALGELVQLRADIARGARRDRVLRKADRLVRTFTELGLRDQERMARLIAIEHAGADGTQIAGAAADPARTAARSPALQPSGASEGGLRPR